MSFDFSFTPSRGPSRNEAKRLAHEAVLISTRGEYVNPNGHCIVIADQVKHAIDNTIEYAPDASIPTTIASTASKKTRARTSVVNGTSLESGRVMAAKRGVTPMILNFASAKHPGGGFLNGARAQEESLCRQSALYACLVNRSMYDFHAKQRDPIYASFMIHSPKVPVFVDDDGKLLEEAWLASFITSPAPNAREVIHRSPERREEVERELKSRVTRLLTVAAHHGHRHLILGAWGCGVFGNEPAKVARAFRDDLDGPFAGIFEEVVFAVLDWSDERNNIRPFVDLFHEPS